jgi:hypothetical protein
MEEQVIQLPSWAIPFFIGLELIIFYVITQFGKLAIICRDAIDWGQQQQSTPLFDAQSFLESITTTINDIRPPIWNAFISFGINIYCIILMYSNTPLNPWVVFIAVYVNTNAIVNLVSTRELTNNIVNTIVQVEQTKMEEQLEKIMEDAIEQFEQQDEEEEK